MQTGGCPPPLPPEQPGSRAAPWFPCFCYNKNENCVRCGDPHSHVISEALVRARTREARRTLPFSLFGKAPFGPTRTQRTNLPDTLTRSAAAGPTGREKEARVIGFADEAALAASSLSCRSCCESALLRLRPLADTSGTLPRHREKAAQSSPAGIWAPERACLNLGSSSSTEYAFGNQVCSVQKMLKPRLQYELALQLL